MLVQARAETRKHRFFFQACAPFAAGYLPHKFCVLLLIFGSERQAELWWCVRMPGFEELRREWGIVHRVRPPRPRSLTARILPYKKAFIATVRRRHDTDVSTSHVGRYYNECWHMGVHKCDCLRRRCKTLHTSLNLSAAILGVESTRTRGRVAPTPDSFDRWMSLSFRGQCLRSRETLA